MTLIRVLAAGLLSLLGTSLAAAQPGSSQPVRIIVPYAAGGVVDVMNRIMALRMAQTLGQPVVVENRPGANANIGPAHVMQAPPDGRTILATASYFSTNPLIESNLQWAPEKLMPVARFAVSPNVFVVSGKSSSVTLKDYLAEAKASPGKPIVDAGRGTTQTMVQQILADTAGVKFTPIQYKGGVSYVPDLISGILSSGVAPFNVALPLVKGGQLHGLAITSSKRSALLPQVPTMAELGFPEAAIDSWLGYHVPAGTPPDVVARLVAAVQDATSNEETRAKLAALGAESSYLDTSAFKAFLQNDLTRAQRAVKLSADNR